MRPAYIFSTATAAFLAAAPSVAQTAESSVLTYPPSFFAEARPNTAYDMIGRVPGFAFQDVGTARGFAGTAANVLINGQRPTTKSDTLQSILQRIPAANVERIELIRGGAPGIDMQGLTVVVNVVLKKADSTTWVLTAKDLVFIDGHQIPAGGVQFTRQTGDVTYEGSAGLVSSLDDSTGHGHHYLFDGDGNLVQNDRTISHGLGIGFNAKGAVTLPLWGGEFKVNATYQNAPFVDSLYYLHPGYQAFFHDNQRDNIGELGLHWKGPVGPLELETLVLQRFDHYQGESDSFDGTTSQLFTDVNDTGETIARAILRYLPSTDLTFEAGGEGAFNFLDGATAFFVDGVDQPLPSAKARVEERRGELFGQGTWKFADNWTLEAGARAEFSTISESGSVNLSRSFFYPKPRAVLTWAPSADTQVRLRYEKVLGQLNFNNFIASADLSATGVTAGNENLRPDQHSQFEISVEQHFWDKGAVVLTLMHDDITDVVDYVPVTAPDGSVFSAPGNIGNGQDNRITFDVTLPLDRVFISGGLLTATSVFDLTSVKDPTTHENRVISGQRPQNINVAFTQDIDSLSSTWGLSYYNCWEEKYFRPDQVRHRKVTPPYFSWFWDYKPSPAWTFHLEVNDIAGFQYNDLRFNYTGRRDVATFDNVDQYIAHGLPQIGVQIRRVF